jgi:hypothetical protein
MLEYSRDLLEYRFDVLVRRQQFARVSSTYGIEIDGDRSQGVRSQEMQIENVGEHGSRPFRLRQVELLDKGAEPLGVGRVH